MGGTLTFVAQRVNCPPVESLGNVYVYVHFVHNVDEREHDAGPDASGSFSAIVKTKFFPNFSAGYDVRPLLRGGCCEYHLGHISQMKMSQPITRLNKQNNVATQGSEMGNGPVSMHAAAVL